MFFAIAQKATALENCRCRHLLPRRCKVYIEKLKCNCVAGIRQRKVVLFSSSFSSSTVEVPKRTTQSSNGCSTSRVEKKRGTNEKLGDFLHFPNQSWFRAYRVTRCDTRARKSKVLLKHLNIQIVLR